VQGGEFDAVWHKGTKLYRATRQKNTILVAQQTEEMQEDRKEHKLVSTET
jgi:hypothetical protein